MSSFAPNTSFTCIVLNLYHTLQVCATDADVSSPLPLGWSVLTQLKHLLYTPAEIQPRPPLAIKVEAVTGDKHPSLHARHAADCGDASVTLLYLDIKSLPLPFLQSFVKLL